MPIASWNGQTPAASAVRSARLTAWTPQTAPVDPFDVRTVNDVPTLNAALKAGAINQSQWQNQFKTIQAKQPGQKAIGGYNMGDFGHNALAQGLNIALAAPKAAQSTGQQIVKQVQYLSQPGSTQAQRNTVMTNQQNAANNPEYIKAVKGITSAPARASIQAQQMAASGVKAPQIRAYLQSQSKALTGQYVTAASNAAILAGVDVAGGGLLGKALGTARAAAGKDAAVNAAIDAQRFAGAAQQADHAATVGKGVVQEAKTTRVPVVSPTETAAARTSLGNTAILNSDRTSVPVTGKSAQVVGKVATNTANDYVKQTAKLSKAYDKEVSAIKDYPPVMQRIRQTQIDTKYQALQQQLDQSAGKTSVAFNGKATTIPEPNTAAVTPASRPLPKSAFDSHEPVAAPAQTTPPPAPTETPPLTRTTPVRGNAALKQAGQGSGTKSEQAAPLSTGASTSGSAVRTEQKAVEAGMQGELSGKAGYNTVSHKAEAAKAVDLVRTNPTKAMDIAMGRTAGDNASHEAAVYHAVANDAIKTAQKTGDWTTVTDLASSPRHTGVSEAAQKLGAEAYQHAPHDPIQIMHDVASARQKTMAVRTGTTVEKEAAKVATAVKQTMPKVSRQEWHNFVESLKC